MKNNLDTKIYEIKAIALMEADGVGGSENMVGLMSNKDEATLWVNESRCYRHLTSYEKTIKIFPTLEAFKADQLEQIRINAIKKLTKEEIAALGL